MQKEKIENYFKQNADLRVLFVFDHTGDILNEVESFAWDASVKVVRFKGDWFATKYMISNLPKGEKIILLMPMDSPLGNEQAMHNFPLLGELCANTYYSDDNFSAFMTSRGLPESMSGFVRNHLSDLGLAKFDKILSPYYGTEFTRDIGYRGLISGLLGESALREWREIFAKIIVLDVEDIQSSKKKLGFYSSLFNDSRYNSDVLAELQEQLKRNFNAQLDPNKDPHLCRVAMSLRYNTVVQNLPCEAGDNYAELRAKDGVVVNRMNQFMQYVSDLPDARRNAFFRAFEKLAQDIHMAHIVEKYGIAANYGAYPPDLCREVLKMLAEKDVANCAVDIKERAAHIAERTEAGIRMRQVAECVTAIANCYLAFGKIKNYKLSTPGEYVQNYSWDWYELDRAYRIAVEKFYAVEKDEDRQIAEVIKAQLNADYAVKVNECNVAWTECLKSSGKGLNGLALYPFQYKFAEKVKDESIKHAVIVSDGLRYEVAKEIEERINSGRHKATLQPCLAMLPSETKYCKPVLLPHQSAQFYNGGDACDIRIDDKWAVTMENRNDILAYYHPEGCCVSTEKLLQMTQFERRALFKKPLVYIYHDCVDSASHGDKTGKDVVESCRKAVEDLTQLIASLHSSYNVGDVWLVSDHGFLMNDVVFEDKDKIPVPSGENARERTSRYYLTDSDAEVHGITKFALKDVSEMADDIKVAVPNGTARLAAHGGYVYAHGGASLQEVVIPMLHSQCLRPDVREKVSVSLVETKLQVISSQLKFKLLQNEVASPSVQGRTVVCALFAGDKVVSQEKKYVLDSTDPTPSERQRNVDLTLIGDAGSSILQLKVYDEEDPLNPLIKLPVTNCTLIERDF